MHRFRSELLKPEDNRFPRFDKHRRLEPIRDINARNTKILGDRVKDRFDFTTDHRTQIQIIQWRPIQFIIRLEAASGETLKRHVAIHNG